MAQDFSTMSKSQEPVAGQDQSAGDHLAYPRSVKVGVILLCAATVVLMGWNLKSRLHIAVPQLGDGVATVENYTKGILDQQDDQLRQQDSDQDGLTDYEELRIYGTSPFIADSDSDGITDANEIKNGTDPNCPTGKTCGFGSSSELATGTRYDTSALQPIVNDPKEIRRLLIEGGVDARVLETIDDQSLQVLAQEALTASTQPTQEKIDLLKNLTPTQIRDLLKQQGVDTTALDQISDDDLMTLYQQALSQITVSNTN